MSRKWAGRIGLIAFGLGLGLVIGLAALRLLRREKALDPIVDIFSQPCVPATGDWYEIVLSTVIDYRAPCWDTYYGSASGGEYYNHIRLNNYGLQDSSLTLEKPDGVFRVLIVGDSFPQGVQVPMVEGFPYLLERALNRRSSRKIEVVNLSVDAYGTDRELLLYSVLGWRFEPDLVILSVYMGNDIQDNEINLEQLRYSYRLNRPFFTLGEDGDLQLHHSENELDPGRFPDSRPYQWFMTMKANQTPAPEPDLPDTPAVLSQPPNYILAYPVGVGLYLPEDSYWARGWAITEALILKMRELVQADSVSFAAVVTPEHQAVHPADWQALIHTVPEVANGDPMAPGTRMMDFLQTNDIPALDVAPALRQAVAQNPETRLYYPFDSHFTPEGHRITADVMARWLFDSGLVPG